MTNKKRLTVSILCLLMLIVSIFAFSACGGGKVENFNLSFKVDGESYSTISTNGAEVVAIPENPSKEGYTFDGWYWDKDVWSKPFTANSLMDAPISSDMSVYAKFSAIEYDITYENDGGTHNNPVSYTIEDGFTLSAAEKLGYSFVAWYSDDAYTTKVESVSVGSTGAISLYAKFEIENYTISYENTKDVPNTNATGYNVNTDTITLSDLSKTGYTFEGWYNGEQRVTEIAKGSTGNLTLTARWSVDGYSITYHNTEGSTNTNPNGYDVEDLPLTLSNASKDYYNFLGWYTEATFENKVTEIAVGTTGNINLYAKWEAVEYTATFKDGNTVVDEIKFTVETDSITAPAVPTHTGYTGVWESYTLGTENITVNAVYTAIEYTATFKDGETIVGTVKFTVETDSITAPAVPTHTGYTGVWESYTLGTENVTVNAVYTAIEYTATFKDGNTVVQEIVFTVETDSITAPAVPTHTGYTGAWENYTLGTEDIVINAIYSKVDYTISYHNMTGANHTNPSGYNVETLPIVLEDATKRGYTFLGWYTEPTFENKVSEIVEGTTGNINLYAKWEIIEYTATFKDGNTVVQEIVFTVETDSITAPAVPVHTGYTGVWESYTLGTENITIDAIYTAIEYTATFKEGSKVVGTVKFTVETVSITEPTVPNHVGYTGVWESYSLGAQNITIDAVYTAIEYTATFKDGDTIVDEIIFTVETESINEPNVPAHTGYTGKWEEYTLGTQDITINAIYEIVPYGIIYHNTTGATHSNPTGYDVEDQPIILKDASKTGYKFIGWYTDATFENKVTEIEIGTTETINLYAKWEAIEYTITYLYDADLGYFADDVVVKVTYTIEDAFDFASLLCKKEGYTFDGWFTEKNIGTGKKVNGVSRGTMGDISVYAHFGLKEYTITYNNVNGATNTNPTNYTVESEDISIYPLSQKGYTFDGWYVNEDCSVAANTIIANGSTGDIVLYAKWTPITYSIEYVTYGGTATGNPTTYIVTDNITFNNATLSGYVFNGWYTAAEGGSKVSGITAGTTGNIILYAHWDYVSTITFESNGGSAVNSITNVEGTRISAPVAPSKENYTFAGWYSDVALTKAYSFQTQPAKDITLYAKWKPVVYEIEYVLNGGTNSENNVTEYTVEDKVELHAPSKVGYTFIGWFTDAEFTSSVVTELKVGTSGKITLYAHYSINQYTISFDSNGGTSVSAITQNFATNVTAPEAPAKNGYTFAGWYTNASLMSKYTFSTMPAENITLYAKWNLATYKITYNLNGGTNSSSNPKTYTITSATITLKEPTKKGYSFAGWFTDADCTKAITEIIAGSYGDVEVFAKWTLTEYTITYIVSEGATHSNILTYTIETDLTTLADATLKGHTFGGWYIDDSYATAVTTVAGGEIGNKTVYAKFTANTYNVWLDGNEEASCTVSFNLNGDEGTIASQTVTPTATLKYPTVPTRDGYIFAGWYDNANCTGSLYDFADIVTNDITLYAKWVKIEGATFIAINGSSNVTLKGTEEQLLMFVPLVSGDITITSSGSYDTYGVLSDLKKGVLEEDDDSASDGKNFLIVENVTAGEIYYIAVRAFSSTTTGSVTISIAGDNTVLDGGYTVTANKTTATYGQDFVFTVPEARDGYKFLGYADEDGIMYTDTNGVSIKTWDKDYDTILYSVWEKAVYTITFNTGTGATTIAPVTLAYGERIDISKYVTTLSGKSFDYWILDGEKFNATTMPDRNITLIAKWKTFTIGKIKYNEDITAVSVHDQLTPKLFGAKCLDSNKHDATITITVNGTFAAGETVSVILIAESGGKRTQETISNIRVYGDPTLNFDNTIDYVNIEGGLTASHFGAIGIDSFGESTTIDVYIEGNYKAGDLVTVTIVAKDIAGNVTKGYVTNVKAYGLPEIFYDSDKTAIRESDTSSLSADFLSATAKDSFGNNVNITTKISVVGANSEFVNGDVYTYRPSTVNDYVYFTALNSEKYTLYHKHGNQANIQIFCVTTNSNVTGGVYSSRDSYGSITFDVVAGYEYYVCTSIGSTSSVKDFSMYLRSQSETIAAGFTLMIDLIATDEKGNTSQITVQCKVYGTPIISEATTLDVKENDNITPELLGVVATDTFGNTLPTSLNIKNGTQKAGNIITVTITSVDIAGNIATKDFDVKVYGKPSISYDRDAIKTTEDASKEYVVVSFDLNGGTGSIASQTITESVTLKYPNIPTRNGYVFKGWYTSEDCTTLYNFTSTINNDITLYAGWEEMVSSGYYSREYIDIYNDNNSSSDYYSFSTSGTSRSAYRYTYFTVLQSGTYKLKYSLSSTTSSTSYAVYLYVYNVTQGKVIKSNSKISSVSFATTTITANAGDVIYVRTYRYSSSYSPTFRLYVEGASIPEDGGIGVYNGASEVLNATATDSFGEALDVSATLKTGDPTKAGSYVVYTLTATDKLGNTYSVDTQPIGVYDIADIKNSFTWNPWWSELAKITSDGKEFEANAKDSFGNDCYISIEVADGSMLKGGQTTNIVIVATDKAGNRVVSDVIENISIYDSPTIVLNNEGYYVEEGTNLSFLFTAYDSFGEELYSEVSYTGTFAAGNYIKVTITATDAAENSITKTFDVLVYSESRPYVELYLDGVLWKTLIADGNSNATLPTPSINGQVFYGWHTADYIFCTSSTGQITNTLAPTNKLYAFYYEQSGYTVITSLTELNAITNSGNYVLARDIVIPEGTYWTPVGSVSAPFVGILDGNGYSVSGLAISSSITHGGMFGYIGSAGIVKNIRLENMVIKTGSGYDATNYAGGIAAINKGTISNVFTSGSLTGKSVQKYYSYAGGLVGQNYGTISNCYSTMKVRIEGSGSLDNVKMYAYAGGIIGYNSSGNVTNCYATGSVTVYITTVYANCSRYMYSYAGGLIGYYSSGTVNGCFATGSVSVGGYAHSTGSYDAYYGYIGGLVGYATSTGTTKITNCYRLSTQTVANNSSYETNQTTTCTLGTTKSASNLQTVTFYTTTLGWSSEIWNIVAGQYPTLK